MFLIFSTQILVSRANGRQTNSDATSQPGHFVVTITELQVPIETEVDDHRLQSAVLNTRVSRHCDHRLGTDKSKHEPKHGLNPLVWTRLTDDPRAIQITGGQRKRDQYESNAVKANEGVT